MKFFQLLYFVETISEDGEIICTRKFWKSWDRYLIYPQNISLLLSSATPPNPLYWIHLVYFPIWINTRWHVLQPCGASRKTKIPMSTRLEPDTTFTAREESGLPCLDKRRGLTPLWNSIGSPRSMSALERNLRVRPQHLRGHRPLYRLERNPKRPLTTRMETWLSWGKMIRNLTSPS